MRRPQCHIHPRVKPYSSGCEIDIEMNKVEACEQLRLKKTVVDKNKYFLQSSQVVGLKVSKPLFPPKKKKKMGVGINYVLVK